MSYMTLMQYQNQAIYVGTTHKAHSDFASNASTHLYVCMLLWVYMNEFCCPLNWIVWFLMLNFDSSFYILDISPLSGIQFAITFSQFVICLFILLAESFKDEIFLILVRFNLTVFY